MYRVIDTAMWTDPKVKVLSSEAKLLFVYLVTNVHSHVSGIYYLPDSLVAREAGLPAKKIDGLFRELCQAALVKRDQPRDVIWVIKMLIYQGKGEKVYRSAANHLRSLHDSPLVNLFLSAYPEVADYYPNRVSDTLSDTSSEPGLSPLQEQDQEQDQDLGDESPRTPLAASPSHDGIAAEPSPVNPGIVQTAELGTGQPLAAGTPAGPDAASLPTDPPVLTFPVVGPGPKVWHLSQAKFQEYTEAYPTLDVMAEFRKALQWLRDHPTRLKTVRGMPGYLGGWLARSQNRGGGYRRGEQGTISPGNKMERIQRLKVVSGGAKS